MTADRNPGSGGQPHREQLARALPKLTAEQVGEVSPKFIRLTFQPGEVIIKQGDPPNRFYILVQGSVEILHEDLQGNTRTVDVRDAGEYFGEIGLLHNSPRTATVVAAGEGEVAVLALERDNFLALIDESRATEAHVARDMVQRLIRLGDYQS